MVGSSWFDIKYRVNENSAHAVGRGHGRTDIAWDSSIPGGKELRVNDSVCYNHWLVQQEGETQHEISTYIELPL